MHAISFLAVLSGSGTLYQFPDRRIWEARFCKHCLFLSAVCLLSPVATGWAHDQNLELKLAQEKNREPKAATKQALRDPICSLSLVGAMVSQCELPTPSELFT